jgi:hypothetical protein
MAVTDLNEEWLGHVQPVGLVVAPSVLARLDLVPSQQTRADSDAARALLSATDDAPALPDPWAFFSTILGWRASRVAGAPGGAELLADVSCRIEESDTEIAPTWAVADPEGGWQILVRIEAQGVKPEARGAIAGWEATPHQRLERLLREKSIPIGLLITDEELRLVYAPKGETSGWIAFPTRSFGEVGGRPMLGGLKLLLGPFPLFNDAPNRRLPAVLKASRDAQAEVSTKLASQVLGALHELLRGLHTADPARIEALAASRQEHLYDGLLTSLLRLVFLLYAEDRDLIPSRVDAAARAFYAKGYGVRTLHAKLNDDRAHYPDTMDERRGAWPRLLALFRLVHQGDSSGAWIRGRGGKLFDPAAFPFLQGQETPSDPARPADVTDGCVFRILDGLVNLAGEKLSYRTLDVEQIGSVYETVMGFAIETRPGPALAIRAGKNDRVPVFVDIAALAAKRGADRAKFLKEEAGRASLSDRVGKALAAASDAAGVIEALRPIVDERGSPGGALSPPGSPLLQPTNERRRTGSHYTPRSLTAPIVEHALEPAFARMGPDARPEAVLDLKVCDPAMGSGAFLVEACRALGERLVKAWARWPETRPKIPDDEDDHLHARRLVAQRCLYGVDKNPRAVDLAKLSLWLATLAREHEFTFLDHALKCGDSLVGLTTAQIASANWDESKPGLPLFRQLVRDTVAKTMRGRAEIQNASDDTMRAIQEARHHHLESEVSPIRMMGDAVVSAFFAADKAKAREKVRAEVESHISGMPPRWDLLEAAAARLRAGEHGVTPFHWQVEFPEVSARDNGGFDAIVGNPPFLGGKRISKEIGERYNLWLAAAFEDASRNADLVAYFFRRAYSLLRSNGALGLIATKSIRQGDTRETGLKKILSAGGSIRRAISKLAWPGEASVVVSIIHVSRDGTGAAILDGRGVNRISAYLVEGNLDDSPERLVSNSGIAFQGSLLLGLGFTFDDDTARRGASASLDDMNRLIATDEMYSTRILPYLGGDEFNSDPRHLHNRYAINVNDLEINEVESSWPLLWDVLVRFVRPIRQSKKNKSNDAMYREWWRYWRPRSHLYKSILKIKRVILISRVTAYVCFSFVNSRAIFSDKLVVIADQYSSTLCTLSSRLHELWALYFGSSMGETPTYNPIGCFQTFPFPTNFHTDPALEAQGCSVLNTWR